MSDARKLLKLSAVPAVLLYAIASPAMAFVQAVPEPDALMLLASGVAAAMIARKFSGRK